jgi:hypothetical protein
MSDEETRVYRLARELGLEPGAVLDLAQRLGYSVRNGLSKLDKAQREAVMRALGRWPPEKPTGAPAKLGPRQPRGGAERRAQSDG